MRYVTKKESETFLSTPSARRATGRRCPPYSDQRISIHALREEGDHQILFHKFYRFISIHALREEGDANDLVFDTDTKISIHALREEGDRSAY